MEIVKKGETTSHEKYSEVSNFEDAKIMAKNKHFPIMVIVGSNKSEFSNKLLNTTLKDPIFLSEFNDIVYLYLDESNNKPLVNDWDIKFFPTILFFNEYGNKVTTQFGFQPADVLALLLKNIKDIKKVCRLNEKFNENINWLYQLEEAKSIAKIQKKNIFVNVSASWAPPSKLLKENVFSDTSVINKLNKEYICLEIEDKRDEEAIRGFGIISFPTLLILDISGKELLRKTGYIYPNELKNWLNIKEEIRILSLLGDEKFKKFQEQNTIAKVLNQFGCFESAIGMFLNLIKIIPDYPELYIELAHSNLWYKKHNIAIDYFEKAIKNGAKIDDNMVSQIIESYLAINNKSGLIAWFENNIVVFKNNKTTLAFLYLGYSELYEILQDKVKALEYAESAVKNNPEIFQTNLQAGRLYLLSNNFSEARKYLNKANELDKSDPQASFCLGMIAEKEGIGKEKEKWFTQSQMRGTSTSCCQSSQKNYASRINYYLYPGYIELIEQSYINALKIEPENDQMQGNLAYFYACENKNIGEALDLINKTIETNPEEPYILDTKVWVLYRLKKYDEANSLLNKIISMLTEESINKDIELLYHIGKVKLSLKDKTSAKKYFERILTIPEPSALGKRIVEDVKKELKSL